MQSDSQLHTGRFFEFISNNHKLIHIHAQKGTFRLRNSANKNIENLIRTPKIVTTTVTVAIEAGHK